MYKASDGCKSQDRDHSLGSGAQRRQHVHRRVIAGAATLHIAALCGLVTYVGVGAQFGNTRASITQLVRQVTVPLQTQHGVIVMSLPCKRNTGVGVGGKVWCPSAIGGTGGCQYIS